MRISELFLLLFTVLSDEDWQVIVPVIGDGGNLQVGHAWYLAEAICGYSV